MLKTTLTLSLAVISLSAISKTFTTGNNWGNSTAWNPAGVPGTLDNAIFPNNTSWTISSNTGSSNSPQAGSITILGTTAFSFGASTGTTFNLYPNGAVALSLSAPLSLSNATIFLQSPGIITGTSSLAIGTAAGIAGGPSSSLNLAGGSFSITNSAASIGNSLSSLVITGGTFTSIGAIGSSATITFSGGSITNNPGGLFASNGSITMSGTAYLVNLNTFGGGSNSRMYLNGGRIDNRTSGIIGLSAPILNVLGASITNAGAIGNSVPALSISGGTINSTGIIGTQATITFSGGSITNNPGGLFASNGSITMSGTAYLVNLNTFGGGSNSKMYLSGGQIDNSSAGVIGSSAPILNVSGASITNAGAIGNSAPALNISGGTINSTGNIGAQATIAFSGGSITIASGTFSNDGSITLSGTAYLVNSGAFGVGSNSKMYLSGGQIDNKSGGVIGKQASVLNISGASITNNSGVIGLEATNITISSGTLTLTTGSQIAGSAGSCVINYNESFPLVNPSLAEIASNALYIEIAKGTIQNAGSVACFSGSVVQTGGRIENTGDFGTDSLITLTGGEFVNNGKLACSSPPALGATKTNVQNQTLQATKTEVNDPLDFQNQDLTLNKNTYLTSAFLGNSSLPNDTTQTLKPIFKKAQFSLEKLDLLLHKELEFALYSDTSKPYLFLVAGYDNLNQSSHAIYDGYDTTSFYQLIGATGKVSKIKLMGAIGFAESYMDVNKAHAKADYKTVYGTLGLSSKQRRWGYGLDVLYGYSFFDGRRNVKAGDTLRNHHGIWNVSVDGKLFYKKSCPFGDYTVYDQIGYLYGHENPYTDKGSIELSMKVKGETISVFRNAVGIALAMPKIKTVQFFIDMSWVFDRYMNNNDFYAKSLNSSNYQIIKDQIPVNNYGRIHAGITGDNTNFNWALIYTGLYGVRFLENSVSFKFGYKF